MAMRNKQSGFTLIELMIVVVIVAILVGVAYPSYQQNVIDTRRANAQGELLILANAMERQQTQSNTYVGVADTTTDFYNLNVQAAAATTYTLRAVPTGAQASDGFFELDNTGARRWDKNNDGDTADAGEDNWDG